MNYGIQQKFYYELVRAGMPPAMAVRVRNDLGPKLERQLSNLQRGNNMTTMYGAVSIANIQARMKLAIPSLGPKDYGVFQLANKIISTYPNWSEDQVYAEVLKSYTPASQGGYNVSERLLQERKMPQYYIIGGGVIAAALLFVMLKKKRG